METAEQIDEQTKAAETEPTEYDASAVQRIPALVSVGDEQLEITLTFDPNADGKSFDRHLQEYVGNLAVTDEPDSSEELALAREEAQLDAACFLFDSVITDLSGIGEDGEEKPDNWRDVFSATEKRAVVDRIILFAQAVGKEPSKGRVAWSVALAGTTTKLRVVFDGFEIETSHTLRKADPKQLRDFTTALLKARDGLLAAFELAGFYDQLKIGARGYKNDAIPVHHKMAVAVEHLTRQVQVIRKNSARSRL